VTEILPFPAALVRAEWADRVVAPMRDTLAPEIAAAVRASNPDSYLHVTRAAEPGEDPMAAVRDNARALARLLDAGAFRRLEEPSMFVYRLRAGHHTQTGIVAEIPVEPFVDGSIRGHEGVHEERVEGVVRHFTQVSARSDLVALMFRRDPVIDEAIVTATRAPPDLVVSDPDLEQTVWILGSRQAVSAVSEVIGKQILYITDGHHRVAASVRRWEEAGRPADHHVLVVLFPDDQLRAFAFHRRVVGPVDAESLLERVRRACIVEVADGPVAGPGFPGLYLDRRWYRLGDRRGGRRPGMAGLDVTFVHGAILEPMFGLVDADNPRLEVVSATVAVEDITDRCDADEGALFLLAPPTLTQLVEVADRGEFMPAKATYFDPKPRSGLFLSLSG
jgi:uncharacterized protein (DUF1015 family)